MTRLDCLGRRLPESRPQDVLAAWLRRGRLGAWVAEAACRTVDPELFFTADLRTGRWSRQQKATIDEAKDVCAGCPVQEQCLAHAMDTRQAGIWGGTTEGERDALRRTRRRWGGGDD